MFDLLTSLLARARSLFYDNTSSGLTAKNVQDAIDEIIATSGGKPFATTLVDPALNAITQSMIDNNSGVVITLTGAGNDQTLPTPTDTTAGNTRFVVINNDSSTHPINIIGGTTSVLDPGKKVKAIWEGTTYAFSEAEGILLDDGTDIKFQNSTRNFDVQTGKYKAGSNTEITEASGDTSIENTSATKNIFMKLGDALGATYAQVRDSAGTVLGYCSSAGVWLLGKLGVAGVVEVRDASNNTQIKLNPVGDSYVNGGNTGFGTTSPISGVDINKSMSWKVRTIASATGTIAITDNVIVIDYTTTGTVALDLPAASTAWNTDGSGIVFTIMDKDANAAGNNITISRAGADTIIDTAAAQTSTVLGTNGGVLHIMPIDSSTWKVF